MPEFSCAVGRRICRSSAKSSDLISEAGQRIQSVLTGPRALINNDAVRRVLAGAMPNSSLSVSLTPFTIYLFLNASTALWHHPDSVPVLSVIVNIIKWIEILVPICDLSSVLSISSSSGYLEFTTVYPSKYYQYT